MTEDEKMQGFLKELEAFDEIIAVSPNTVHELQTRIAELEQQNHTLKTDGKAWRVLAENLQLKLDELREDAGLIRAMELANAAARIQDLEQQNAKLREENIKYELRSIPLEEEVLTLKEQLAERDASIEYYRGEVNRLNNVIADRDMELEQRQVTTEGK